ncbi:hypothetical protein T492DRAFT_850134 [Pavlovales sp. CCMP2436]|nr:hypothetical protein T492DRAFT_850134 [Pavlovales sp. CCMP2436]
MAGAAAGAARESCTREEPGVPLTASCLALVALVLAVYARTAFAGVASGDSGEMVQIAYVLGVAHPPGYPLWTMLAHLFDSGPTMAESQVCWEGSVPRVGGDIDGPI